MRLSLAVTGYTRLDILYRFYSTNDNFIHVVCRVVTYRFKHKHLSVLMEL